LEENGVYEMMLKPAAERSERKAGSAALFVTQKWVSEMEFINEETWYISVMMEESLGTSDLKVWWGGMGVMGGMVMMMLVAHVERKGKDAIGRRPIAPARAQ